MTENQLIIREIKPGDMGQLVFVHQQAFQNFFLTELGESFLKKFYLTLGKHPDGILTGVFQGDLLIGFCAATKYSAGFYKKLILSNPVIYGVEGLKLLTCNFSALLRLLKNLTKAGAENNDTGNYAELLSIAVLPDKQGLGAGKIMLNDLEENLKNQHVRSIALTTDQFNNEKTIRFYEGLNYQVLYEFVAHPDRKMFKMLKNL